MKSFINVSLHYTKLFTYLSKISITVYIQIPKELMIYPVYSILLG